MIVTKTRRRLTSASSHIARSNLVRFYIYL